MGLQAILDPEILKLLGIGQSPVPAMTGIGGPNLGDPGFTSSGAYPTMGGGINSSLEQMMQGQTQGEQPAQGKPQKDPMAEALKAEANARQKFLDLQTHHKTQAPKIESPRLGSQDILTGLLPTLLLSLMNGEAGAAYGSGFLGGKVQDANRRTEQNGLDAQASERDYQNQVNLSKIGLDFASQDRQELQGEQRYQESLARSEKKDAQGVEEDRARQFLNVAHALPVPQRLEDVDAYVGKMKGLYSQASRVPGYEAWASSIPDAAQMKRDIETGLKADIDKESKAEQGKRATEYGSRAVQARSSREKAMWYGRLASLYPVGSEDRRLAESEVQYWQKNKTPEEEDKAYGRTKDQAANTVKAIDEELQQARLDLKDVEARGKTRPLSPEEQAYLKEQRMYVTGLIKDKRKALTTPAESKYTGGGNSEFSDEDKVGPFKVNQNQVPPDVLTKTPEQNKALSDLTKLQEDFKVFLPEFQRAKNNLQKIAPLILREDNTNGPTYDTSDPDTKKWVDGIIKDYEEKKAKHDAFIAKSQILSQKAKGPNTGVNIAAERKAAAARLQQFKNDPEAQKRIKAIFQERTGVPWK